MNTTPDDVMLALWLDDELEGEDFAAVEAWAANQPGQLAAREEVRSWRKRIAGALPRAEEPPFADFFNSRIRKALTEVAPPVPVESPKAAWWRAFWWMPAAAAAGMVFAFWLGARTGPGETGARVVYTPDSSVKADYFTSRPAEATVIVLDGVAAIPDSLEFTATAVVEPNPAQKAAAVSTGQPQPGGTK